MFTNNFVTAQSLYVSAVVGPLSSNGIPLLTDACTVISNSTSINFLTEIEIEIETINCDNGFYNVEFNLNGGFGDLEPQNTYAVVNVNGQIFNTVSVDETVIAGPFAIGTALNIEVEDSKFCSNSINNYIVDCVNGGGSSNQNIQMKTNESIVNIYPNPVVDVLNITIDAIEMKTLKHIKLFNIEGALIKDLAINNKVNNYKIDMLNYQAGIYLLEIRNGDKFETFKVIKR